MPSRWIRTLPWLAGLLIGASAHIVWWTQSRPEPETVVVEVPAPAAPVHVHVHRDEVPEPVVQRTSGESCRGKRARRNQARTRETHALQGASGAVLCTSDGCTIRRDFLARILHRPHALGRHLRVVNVRDAEGANQGLRLFGIRPGSLADLVGLNNGDTVVAVDGEPLVDPGPLMKLYGELTRSDGFELTVQRRDQTHTLRYRIVDS